VADGMKKSERLNGIIFAIKENNLITASKLAKLFEVSMRTIYRDIDALSQLKVPIITHEGVHGGYSIDEAYFLPSIQLSEREIIMLLMVLKAGEAVKLPNLNSDYLLLRSKLINSLCELDREAAARILDRVYFSINQILPKAYASGVLDAILQAFRERRNLVLSYYSARRDEADLRMVSPKELSFSGGGWYLEGYCHLRKEKRMFRLDRIETIELHESENTMLDVPLTSSTDKYQIREYSLLVEKAFFRILKDNEVFQNVQEVDEGHRLQLIVRTPYEDELTRLLLSEPNRIQAVGPVDFLQRLKEIIKELNNIY
jgi:predicted DNA-binding transcriptional regulator YafY